MNKSKQKPREIKKKTLVEFIVVLSKFKRYANMELWWESEPVKAKAMKDKLF